MIHICRYCGQRIRKRNGEWVCDQTVNQQTSGGYENCPAYCRYALGHEPNSGAADHDE
jgi:ribosomal protein L37AE/L43A